MYLKNIFNMDFKLSKNKKSTTINSIESSFTLHLHVTIETFMRFDWKKYVFQ